MWLEHRLEMEGVVGDLMPDCQKLQRGWEVGSPLWAEKPGGQGSGLETFWTGSR